MIQKNKNNFYLSLKLNNYLINNKEADLNY